MAITFTETTTREPAPKIVPPQLIVLIDGASDSEDEENSSSGESSDEELATPLPESADEEGEEEGEDLDEVDSGLAAGESLSLPSDSEIAKSLVEYHQHLMKPDGGRKVDYYLSFKNKYLH